MVLHNDKWKYKAKKDYLHKHNLSTVKQDERKNLEDEKKEVLESKSNTWRFHDPDIDPELLKDPEYVKQILDKQNEELNYNNEQSSKVLHKLEKLQKTGELNKVNLESEKGSVNKSWKKMTDEDLKNWKLDASDEEIDKIEDAEGNNSKIREFTEDEKNNFLKLQHDISKKKQLEKMKLFLKKDENTHKKGKVLEINSTNDRDKYKGQLEDTFQQRLKEDKRGELDDLIGELIGMDLKEEVDTDKEEDKKTEMSKFDLDELLGSKDNKTNKGIKGDKKERGKKKSKIHLGEEAERFVSDLLI